MISALNEMDTRYFPLIGVTFSGFMTVHFLLPYLSARWCSKYKQMTTKERTIFDNKLCSTIHSMTVSIICLSCFFVEGEEFFRSKLRSNSSLVKINICIVIGYMFSDTFHMLYNREHLGNAQFVIHHMVSIFPLWYVMAFNHLSWFGNFRIIAEISTFFINVRWFLDETFRFSKTSNSYIAVGVMLTISFVLTRLVTIPYYYYPVYVECKRYTCTPAMYFWMLVPPLVLDILSVWWTKRLVIGFRKIFYENWLKGVILGKNEHKMQ